MKKAILLALLIVSTGVLSSSKKSTPLQTVNFYHSTTAFKRDLGNAD
jgi:hypothetical protein